MENLVPEFKLGKEREGRWRILKAHFPSKFSSQFGRIREENWKDTYTKYIMDDNTLNPIYNMT